MKHAGKHTVIKLGSAQNWPEGYSSQLIWSIKLKQLIWTRMTWRRGMDGSLRINIRRGRKSLKKVKGWSYSHLKVLNNWSRCFVHSFVGCFVDCFVRCFVRCFVHCFVCCFVCCSVHFLFIGLNGHKEYKSIQICIHQCSTNSKWNEFEKLSFNLILGPCTRWANM